MRSVKTIFWVVCAFNKTIRLSTADTATFSQKTISEKAPIWANNQKYHFWCIYIQYIFLTLVYAYLARYELYSGVFGFHFEWILVTKKTLQDRLDYSWKIMTLNLAKFDLQCLTALIITLSTFASLNYNIINIRIT